MFKTAHWRKALQSSFVCLKLVSIATALETRPRSKTPRTTTPKTANKILSQHQTITSKTRKPTLMRSTRLGSKKNYQNPDHKPNHCTPPKKKQQQQKRAQGAGLPLPPQCVSVTLRWIPRASFAWLVWLGFGEGRIFRWVFAVFFFEGGGFWMVFLRVLNGF